MRGSLRFSLAGLVIAGFVQSAWGAEMIATEIKELISGNTVYIELNTGAAAGTGQGAIYYGADGKATFKTPSGPIWDGSWTIKENTVCVDWKQLPNNPCTKYEKQESTITLINMGTGKPRGKIVKVAPGNPEKL
jgi:hypothetical protein